MTFKNFYLFAKRPEIYERVGYFYFESYRRLLYLLNEDKDFFEEQVNKFKSRAAKDSARNDLKITLERIQFVNKCKNNEF